MEQKYEGNALFKKVMGEEERWPCFLHISSEIECVKGVRAASREALENDERS